MSVEIGQMLFTDLGNQIERAFRQFAGQRLNFTVEFALNCREVSIPTQTLTPSAQKSALQRLSQSGEVRLQIEPALSGWSPNHETLNSASGVIVLVRDTGIGIAADKQKVIFEAFQQAAPPVVCTAARLGLSAEKLPGSSAEKLLWSVV